MQPSIRSSLLARSGAPAAVAAAAAAAAARAAGLTTRAPPGGASGATPPPADDPDSPPGAGEQLYGREDRDPLPSPNPGLRQATLGEMSLPRDEPPALEGDDEAQRGAKERQLRGAAVPAGSVKAEGLEHPDAYPVQNDPSVPKGAGPELREEEAAALGRQGEAEAGGPKAAGQGVVEGLSRKDRDPERYGSGRGSPA